MPAAHGACNHPPGPTAARSRAVTRARPIGQGSRMLIRTAVLILASSSLLRVCGRDAAPPPQVGPMGAASASPAMMPEHGGAVAVSGGLVAEVNAMPDGRLVA